MTEDRKTLRINDVTLDWEWAVSLEPGWFYSVRVGRDEGASGPPDNPLPCFHFKFSDETEFQGPLEFCEPGRHYWEVVVAARNEGFISTPEITEFDEEEVEEFIEISEVSFREYFDINPISPTSTDTPVPPPPTPTPIPEDTPTSPPPDDDDGGGDGGNGNGGGCKFPPC
jgi:hypothetical protein